MRIVSHQPDLPKVDVEPSVVVVEESSPVAAAVAAEPISEEPAPVTPVPPVTVVQVRHVSLSKRGWRWFCTMAVH